jgi:hypothetical protein
MTTKNTRSDLLTQLKDGIARLTSSEAWCDYLAFQSRFHHYSYGNALLIAAQCPAATHVAGFTTWRKLQRSVRKGEKAIWILAPMVGKRSANDDPDADQFVRGFKYVAVFDIGQTVGEVPPAVCTKLSGDDPSRFYVRFVEVARCFGFGVADYAFGDTTNGDSMFPSTTSALRRATAPPSGSRPSFTSWRTRCSTSVSPTGPSPSWRLSRLPTSSVGP